MTSVYTDKIYADIASAPEDDPQNTSQNYRLKKIEEAAQFLPVEIKTRDKLAKDFKRRATASTVSDTSIITAITLLEIASVTTLTTRVEAPISIALASTGFLLGLGSRIIHKTQKIFESIAKKHDKIKILAESKLDSISELVSKVIEDTQISHDEYHFILKEIEHYRVMKEEIRNKSKKKVDTITVEQREALLAQGRKEGEQAVLQRITASSATPAANAT